MSGRDIKDGYDFESIVLGHYQSKNFFAIRSHMSRGPVDVVAINRDRIYLVQCKLDRNFKIESEEEKDTFNQLKELQESIDGSKALYALYNGVKPVFFELNEIKEESHIKESNYECESCGNMIESKGKPYKCPCGSRSFNLVIDDD